MTEAAFVLPIVVGTPRATCRAAGASIDRKGSRRCPVLRSVANKRALAPPRSGPTFLCRDLLRIALGNAIFQPFVNFGFDKSDPQQKPCGQRCRANISPAVSLSKKKGAVIGRAAGGAYRPLKKLNRVCDPSRCLFDLRPSARRQTSCSPVMRHAGSQRTWRSYQTLSGRPKSPRAEREA
jgi:hypothetical protein